MYLLAFSRVDGDQPVPGLPLLIGHLAAIRSQKPLIILHCFRGSFQVVVGSGTQKVRRGTFREKLRARIQRTDRQIVVLVFGGDDREIAVEFGHVRLQLGRHEQLVLRLGKLLFLHQHRAQREVGLCVLRQPLNGGAELLFCLGILAGFYVKGSKLQCGMGIASGAGLSRIQRRGRFLILSFRGEHAAQLNLDGAIAGIDREELAQLCFRVGEILLLGVDVGESGDWLGGLGIEFRRGPILASGRVQFVLLLQQQAGG